VPVSQSASLVCGLDEAGRGALAGPIVIASVSFPAQFSFAQAAPDVVARDSKLLSPRQRAVLYAAILDRANAVDVEVIESAEIDERGINWANTEGFRRLVARSEATRYIVDGRWQLGELGAKASRVRCEIRADQTVPATLAAGVVAKVRRDEIMQQLDQHWPMYGWSRNTGHGTREHVEAIRMFGTSPQHRSQFVATALGPRRRRKPHRRLPQRTP
jgi:ribonuclease HII